MIETTVTHSEEQGVASILVEVSPEVKEALLNIAASASALREQLEQFEQMYTTPKENDR